MSDKIINIFGVDVSALSMPETVAKVDQAIQQNQQLVHNCINANKVVLMETDPLLRESLDEADIVSADGQAVVWSSRLLGEALPERVPGIDLMENLMELAKERQYKVYLFGAKEAVVSKVASYYNELFSAPIVVGYRNGYYTEEDEPAIIEAINKSEAQLLFVAIPSPQKELFIKKYRDQLPKVFLLMGVGGSFDVISGTVPRAPRWMQDNGLEWFYRLIQEPRKMWRRYLIGNWKYIYLTFKSYFSSK
jgi:N-acetylglucosaminyldiphosphoundecaprenol N-acetyl-beta-D-mannosaminyltransferase